MIAQPGFKEMKPVIPSEINPRRLRHFLKYIILSKKKLKKSNEAKEDLVEHLNKIKRKTRGKKNNPTLTNDIEELEKKINYAIETEKKLYTQQKKEYFFSKFLEKRVVELETRINEFLIHHRQRKNKIDQIEKKVKNKVMTRSEQTQIIRQQIEELEKKYNSLKSKYPKEALKNIEEKIFQLKQKLTNP